MEAHLAGLGQSGLPPQRPLSSLLGPERPGDVETGSCAAELDRDHQVSKLEHQRGTLGLSKPTAPRWDGGRPRCQD